MATTKRPLVATHVDTEFGEALSDMAEFQRVTDLDHTYVPGFSDLRRARDIALGEVHAGRKTMRDVPTLPVNCIWVRRTTKSGEPDSQKQVSTANDGYRTVTKDDLAGKNVWLTGMPPGAVVLPDGSIAKGDVVLMVADAATARRNAMVKTTKTQQMLNSVPAAALYEEGAKHPGADPTYESTKG